MKKTSPREKAENDMTFAWYEDCSGAGKVTNALHHRR